MCITAALKPVPSKPKKMAVITFDAGHMLSMQTRPEQQQQQKQRVPAAEKSRKRREKSGGLCSTLRVLLVCYCSG